MIPYGRHTLEDDDIQALAQVIKTGTVARGPKVAEFENDLARYCGARYAVVFANGTLALKAAYFASSIGPGDEFVTTPISFISTATAGLWFGAKAVFADIDQAEGNITAATIAPKITPRTKVITPVDFSGIACDLDEIAALAKKHNCLVIEDACHAWGGEYQGKKIGRHSDMTVLSFHPVKSICTGEGGAVMTDNEALYKKILLFRNNGIVREPKDFINPNPGDWYYEMQTLGDNCHLTDFQCALGISQLKKLDSFIARRTAIVKRYEAELGGVQGLVLPAPKADKVPAWHIYVIRLTGQLAQRRDEIFKRMREQGIGVQVHYVPIHWHPYFQKLGYLRTDCPQAVDYYQHVLTLPVFPLLTDDEQTQVIATLKKIIDT